LSLQQAKKSNTSRFETPANRRRFFWMATWRYSLRALAWPNLPPRTFRSCQYACLIEI